MTKTVSHNQYCDCYEYHGGTLIERIRQHAEGTIWRDWIMFDSIEEASDFFNDACEWQPCWN
ncbi:MAG: hypothetical protein KJO34_09010 [Deltaproteobacteria bacterium]|nr:hypothetical protein [Deltaproteobacteria bacterium]